MHAVEATGHSQRRFISRVAVKSDGLFVVVGIFNFREIKKCSKGL